MIDRFSGKRTAGQKIGVLIAVALIGGLLLRGALGGFTLTRGGFTPTNPDTDLRLSGHLENKDTGQALTNTMLTLVGDGLPVNARTDSNGNLSVLSRSLAEDISVRVIAPGYKPYRLTIIREARVTVCNHCIQPVFLLIPKRHD